MLFSNFLSFMNIRQSIQLPKIPLGLRMRSVIDCKFAELDAHKKRQIKCLNKTLEKKILILSLPVNTNNTTIKYFAISVIKRDKVKSLSKTQGCNRRLLLNYVYQYFSNINFEVYFSCKCCHCVYLEFPF